MSSQKGAAVQDSWWLEVTCGVAALVHMGGRPQTHAQGFLFTWKSRNLPQWDGKQEASVTPSSGRARGKPGPGCRGLGTLTSSAHSSFLDTCDNDFLEHGRLTSPSLIGMNESPRRLGSRAKDERKSGHLGRATRWTSFTRPGPWPETGDHVGVFQVCVAHTHSSLESPSEKAASLPSSTLHPCKISLSFLNFVLHMV